MRQILTARIEHYLPQQADEPLRGSRLSGYRPKVHVHVEIIPIVERSECLISVQADKESSGRAETRLTLSMRRRHQAVMAEERSSPLLEEISDGDPSKRNRPNGRV